MKLIPVLKCRRSVSLTWELKGQRVWREDQHRQRLDVLSHQDEASCVSREQRHRKLFTGAPLSLKLITRIILLLIVPRSPTEPGNDADSIYQGWRWGQKGSGGVSLEKCANNSAGWIPPATVLTKNKVRSQEFKGESWEPHTWFSDDYFLFWAQIFNLREISILEKFLPSLDVGTRSSRRFAIERDSPQNQKLLNSFSMWLQTGNDRQLLRSI